MSCRKLTEALYEPSSPIYLAMVPRPPPPAIEEGACTPDASTSGSPERTSPAARKVSRLQAAINVAQHLTAPETTADGRPSPETRARATAGAEQVYHLQMRLKPRSLHNTVDDCHQCVPKAAWRLAVKLQRRYARFVGKGKVDTKDLARVLQQLLEHMPDKENACSSRSSTGGGGSGGGGGGAAGTACERGESGEASASEDPRCESKGVRWADESGEDLASFTFFEIDKQKSELRQVRRRKSTASIKQQRQREEQEKELQRLHEQQHGQQHGQQQQQHGQQQQQQHREGGVDDGGLLGGEQLQQKQLQQVLKVRAEQQLARKNTRKNNPAAARRKVKAMQGRVLETTTAPLDPLPRC
jgi:hypothetical protein